MDGNGFGVWGREAANALTAVIIHPHEPMSQLLQSPALAAPHWLESAALPAAQAIGLPRLAGVVHITLIASLASFALQYTSHILSPKLFPKHYPKLKPKQDDWDLHVVSRTHPSALATPYPQPLTRHSLTVSRSDGPTHSSQPHLRSA